VVENAGRPDGQAHHHPRIDDAPGGGREPLDQSHNSDDPEVQSPRDLLAFLRRTPQSHTVEGCQEVVQGIVSLSGPDHQREGTLYDERGEPGVKALVALRVGEKDAAQSVQAPLERGENKR